MTEFAKAKISSTVASGVSLDVTGGLGGNDWPTETRARVHGVDVVATLSRAILEDWYLSRSWPSGYARCRMVASGCSAWIRSYT